ncbi:MAG TPA: hypothetical protein VL949_11050 [Geobacteraceae bacterium]|nr:hypothetical protein [Geobacteraceae bacterium]
MPMLTTVVNVVAFYLGALFSGSSHSLIGVVVFVVTALFGTLVSTLLEAYLQTLLAELHLVRARRTRSSGQDQPSAPPS